MSIERRQPFIHPFNYYLVQYGVEAFHEAFAKGYTIPAMKTLYVLVGWLEPSIKKKLKKEIAMLELMWKNNSLATEERVREIQWKIANALHEAGYFLAAKGIREVLVGGENIEIKSEEERR